MTRYVKLVSGEEIEMTAEEIVARQAEEAAWLESRNKKPDPTELEIRLAALEGKLGIIEQDKESAKTEFMTKEK